ncbi:uncharacterized protein [Parasteatoda tepidariorum]|uniref:uncharacterized protein n=1 Tax=Parasteatoda tepidariorum TaxID=114398 RepID=UPI0039BC2E19
MEYYLQVKCPGSSYRIEGCFTLNTIIGRPETKPLIVPTKGVYLLLLTPHAEEYPPLTEEVVSAHLSIHNPRQIVNPFSKGISMTVKTAQTLRLKKVVQKLLPPPYDTNCQDYIEMWKQRGGHGPINQNECFEECLKNVSMQVRGCIPRFYQMPGNERRCIMKD